MQELPGFHQHPWLWLVGSSYEDVVGQIQENGMELICNYTYKDTVISK